MPLVLRFNFGPNLPEEQYRRVGLLLLLALWALPLLFCWILFRKGYAPSTRKAVFIYIIGMPVFDLLVLIAHLFAMPL